MCIRDRVSMDVLTALLAAITGGVCLYPVSYTHLFAIGSGKRKTVGRMLREAFLNLICISAVIGVFCFVNSISLPQPIYDALEFSANTTVCLSMIYIGTLLAVANIKEIFKDRKVYVFSFVTLIIMPLFTKAVASLFLDGIALSVLVVLMGTPAAAALSLIHI